MALELVDKSSTSVRKPSKMVRKSCRMVRKSIGPMRAGLYLEKGIVGGLGLFGTGGAGLNDGARQLPILGFLVVLSVVVKGAPGGPHVEGAGDFHEVPETDGIAPFEGAEGRPADLGPFCQLVLRPLVAAAFLHDVRT